MAKTGRELTKSPLPDIVPNMADLLGTEAGDIEIVQTGGVTKWIDLRQFQEDPKISRDEPCKGNGKAIIAQLISRQEMEVDADEPGYEKEDGTKVRFFYNLRLLAPCPVAYRDENKVQVEEIAQPGEVVSIGERHKLTALREWTEDGGVYVLGIQPHSRIKVGGGRNMWTFVIGRKVIRPPLRVKAELVTKTPF